MPSQAIQPLRIQKNSPSKSPNKTNGAPVQRPLTELSPMERRRNSPSFVHSSKLNYSRDSSPFESSPFSSTSPHLYWQSRDPGSPSRLSTENRSPLEQRDSSPSRTKRSSIENLKRASRVKNSNMFAREHKQEYDPTSSPVVERPLATGRPLSVQVQGNAYGGRGIDGFRQENKQPVSQISNYSPDQSPARINMTSEPQKSPSKGRVSPTKSSLSSRSRYAQAQAFDPENGVWSEDEDEIAERKLPLGKELHNHAKSVTFDAAPPQINEYEMTTPVPSSIASGSRDGSYESADADEDESFDRGSSAERDDSFDDSLEDTDKTPVVLPEDWRFMSPGLANDELAARVEDPFEGPESSPAPTAMPTNTMTARPSPTRTDSTASNGERRPLPPLPSLGMPSLARPRSNSNTGLSATAERVSGAHRLYHLPPRPASISKSEIQGMGGCSMSLEERLRLMMIQDDESSKTASAEQREERLERVGSSDQGVKCDDKKDDSFGIKIHEDNVEEDVVGDLGDYQLPPRISRESILRKVKGQRSQRDFADSDFSSLGPSSSPDRNPLSDIDPDVPIPSLEGRLDQLSLEDTEASVVIKQEEDASESEVDVYSIPDLYSQQMQFESHLIANEVQEALGAEGTRIANGRDDDEESHYSTDLKADEYQEPQSHSATEDEGPPTPRAPSPKSMDQTELATKIAHRMSLPQFASMLGEEDFGFGMEQFMTPSPPLTQEPFKTDIQHEAPQMQHTAYRPMTPEEEQASHRPMTPEEQQAPHRPVTPEEQQAPLRPVTPEEQQAPHRPVTPEEQQAPLRPVTPEEQQAPHRPVTPEEQQAPLRPVTPEEQQAPHRPVTPEEQLLPPRFPGYGNDSEDEPKTPDSVIRHSLPESLLLESPGVPEPIATIKAPGGRLKTRPSITPADIHAMAESRRQVSGQGIAPVPERHCNRRSVYLDAGQFQENSISKNKVDREVAIGDPSKQLKRRSSLVQLDIPVSGLEDGLSLGLDKEFDRVMESQKVVFALPPENLNCSPRSPGCAEYMAGQGFRPISERIANRPIRSQKGYLMRQNTKVVVARSASDESASDVVDSHGSRARGTRSAGNSPRKASQAQTWTTEPWNGKVRRKSIRQSGGSPQKRAPSGPVPPLPGQHSNVTSDLGNVNEDEAMSGFDESEDGAERGRLFVKVVGVKDLDLPLPRAERSYFALTLDNGLHCVTTAWLELGKNAPIGQEFELIVLNDLEFQLTLQTKLEEPKPQPPVIPESPTKSVKASKASTFSRVFASPKKRKELELRQQEEVQRLARQKQQEAQASRRAAQPTAWDLLNGLVAKDGSFARSYVCLKDHENSAYGRPYTVDVPCFNEWATETVQTASSVKSKRDTVGGNVQRKAPYRIGKLELQLLFVPKPKGAKDDDMPKSMNACIRELEEARVASTKTWEGHLSQQGGDCPYWRRRFFKLEGSKLTAFHESTRQPRANINLGKASKLIDDKTSLMQAETTSKGRSRRKSAFAEEEEGYMFVEEGFRVRFANGETIDFYADSAAEKDGWMKVLADVVGKDLAFGKSKAWTDLVLAKQRAASAKSSKAEQGQTKAPPMRSAPPTPGRKSIQKQQANLAPPENSAKHHSGRANHPQARSMLF